MGEHEMTEESCCTPSRGAGSEAPAPAPAPAVPRDAAPAPGGMVALPGGTFRMGTDDEVGFPGDGEGPVREVAVAPFEVDAYAVTNERFAAFVEATGYVTEAERFGWSFVFAGFLDRPVRDASPRPAAAPWWRGVQGACWHAPEGAGSDLDERADHPVVHVSWNDAMRFCEWSGTRLPTEAEWEYAARGGLDQCRYPWGDTLRPRGRHMCNIWQGRFPEANTGEDGYVGTAPVTAYEPNGYGLHNVSGNVWEWCSDRWRGAGPDANVMRGGSYLCHASYCNRYRVAARTSNTPDSSTGNLGFRCVRDSPSSR